MALRKPDFPHYKTTLPVSGKDVKYRPYTSKEEKIILFAAMGKKEEEMLAAAEQIIENCTEHAPSTLHPVDVEWMYVKLYAASVSKITDVELPVNCGTEPTEDEEGNLIECPGYIDVKVNLETDIELRGTGILEEMGYKRRGDAWVVPFTEDSGVVFKLLSTTKEDQYEVLYDAFDCLFYGEEVTSKAETTLEEFKEWLDDLPRPVADKIEMLFEFQPYLIGKIKGTCPVCGKLHEREVSGVLDFLG